MEPLEIIDTGFYRSVILSVSNSVKVLKGIHSTDLTHWHPPTNSWG